MTDYTPTQEIIAPPTRGLPSTEKPGSLHKKTLTEINGFTPVYDLLLDRYGITTALVFGRMERFAATPDRKTGQSSGICSASMESIGYYLRLSRTAVWKSIKQLEEGGYIQDLTPRRRNTPHEYQVSDRMLWKHTLDVFDAGAKGGDGVNNVDSELPAGVHAGVNATVHVGVNDVNMKTGRQEDNKERKEEEETSTSVSSEFLKSFESEIGSLTPKTIMTLTRMQKDYPEQWLKQAIVQAVRHNARNLAYIEATLKDWRSMGGPEHSCKKIRR